LETASLEISAFEGEMEKFPTMQISANFQYSWFFPPFVVNIRDKMER